MKYKDIECERYTVSDLMQLPTTSVVFCVRHVYEDKYEECLLVNCLQHVNKPTTDWLLVFGNTTEKALGSIQRGDIFACAVQSLHDTVAATWGAGAVNASLKLLMTLRGSRDNGKFQNSRNELLDAHILQTVNAF